MNPTLDPGNEDRRMKTLRKVSAAPRLRPSLICLACALALVPPAFGFAKPNVIFILTDDQGYGDLSAHGNPVLKTPKLDALRDDDRRYAMGFRELGGQFLGLAEPHALTLDLGFVGNDLPVP